MESSLQAGDFWAHRTTGDFYEVTIGEHGPVVGIIIRVSMVWWAAFRPNIVTIDGEYAGESAEPALMSWGTSPLHALQQWQESPPQHDAETGSL